MKYIPRFTHSLLILLVATILTSLSSRAIFTISKDNKNILIPFLSLVLTSLIMFYVVYFFMKRKSNKSVFYGLFSKKFNSSFFYTIIPIVMGTMVLNLVIGNLISVTDTKYTDFMTKLVLNKGNLALFMIPIVVLAPITEELIFRGMILKDLAKDYTSLVAIIISALYFSIIHLDLAQIPNAFILGVVFAILMIHSKNILYVIVYHLLNNLLVTLSLFFVTPQEMVEASSKRVEMNLSYGSLFFLSILGLFLIYLGLKWSIKTISKENRAILPSKKVYNSYLDSFIE